MSSGDHQIADPQTNERASGQEPRRISRRLYSDYSFLVWAIGWVALLKGVIWLSTAPNLPDAQLTVLGYKYAAVMIPFIVCGIGLWKMKRWAAWGLIVLCGGEILFFIFCPFALNSLEINKTSLITMILSQGTFIINGPISAIAVLLCAPFLFSRLAD